jgi:hypothetical protein
VSLTHCTPRTGDPQRPRCPWPQRTREGRLVTGRGGTAADPLEARGADWRRQGTLGYQVWLAALVRPFSLGNPSLGLPSLPLATCWAVCRSGEGWEGGSGGEGGENGDGGKGGENTKVGGKHPEGGECCWEGEGGGGSGGGAGAGAAAEAAIQGCEDPALTCRLLRM